MSYIFIDGLWEKEGTNSALFKIASGMDPHPFYYAHTMDVSKIQVKNGDVIFGFSLGGRTALHLIESRPQVQFDSAIFIDPVFGFCWFGCKKIVHGNVSRFLQVKASRTLPWAIWQYVVRDGNQLYSQDRFVKVSSGHGDCPTKALPEIQNFLES